METKICTKCKKEQDVSCFHKNKSTKDGLHCWCRCCRNRHYKDNAPRILKQQKQYYKDNAPRILEQRKQYQKDNTLRILKYQKQWNKDNVPKKAKYNKQWHKDNTEYRKQYNKDNAPRITEQRKQYNKDNVSQIKQYRKDNALFESYFKKLEVFEEIRPCLENLKLLEVKCAYCGKWTKPTNLQVKNRLQSFNGTNAGESRFYCSENCKQSCPIYNKIKWPRGFKKATSREVVPLLRQLVLERDGYTCQKCGATTETAQLHVHHEKSYTLNKVMANDPDNCITLCKDCHKQVHSREGCKYSDLKC